MTRHFYVKSAGMGGLLENPLPASYWSETQKGAKARMEREGNSNSRFSAD